MHLKHEVTSIAAHGVVMVHVENAAAGVPTYAVAWVVDDAGSIEPIGLQPVGDDGVAMFLLRHDKRYNVGAWSDTNGDKVYDGGEPAASVRDVQPLPLDTTSERAGPLPLRLDASNGLPAGQRFVVTDNESELGDALAIHVGEVVSLDDPRFTVENGEMGMWRPFEFLQRFGVGIYFLGPYDPQKLPVIFVYGISGSPQDWRVMLESLDTTKVQPWFFHYPGGMRIERSAGALVTGMLMLEQKLGFARLAVVAHSMGGLVSRGAIQRAAEQAGSNFIPRFVSISTPWGGHESAADGVRRLNYPVPSWRDMDPQSDYLRSILSRPLPAGTQHDLIFSFKTTGGFGMPNDNDGTVGVASELVTSVQEQAHSVFGLPLGHAEILTSPVTLRHVEAALRVP
ncbi:MAG TPA: hypothetical protein VFZ65_12115 [Planctomycetota bacterium]|nr:hypothetical protein [Planctomycetota bacterium]